MACWTWLAALSKAARCWLASASVPSIASRRFWLRTRTSSSSLILRSMSLWARSRRYWISASAKASAVAAAWSASASVTVTPIVPVSSSGLTVTRWPSRFGSPW